MKRLFILALIALCVTAVSAQRRGFKVRQNVPLDSIRMSDPAILADKATNMAATT